MSTVALLLAVVAIVATAANLLLSAGNARRLRQIGDRRPPVTPGGLADGKNVPDSVLDAIAALDDQLPIQRLVIVVASGSCPACQNLARNLNRAGDEIADLPIVIVDSSEPPAPKFRDLLTISAKVIPDDKKQLYSAMEVTAVPYSFLVEDGRVLSHVLGEAIDTLLKELRGSTRVPIGVS